MTEAATSETIKRGDKQLLALEIFNKLEEDYTLESFREAVGLACFPEADRVAQGKVPLSIPERDANAMHLIKYLIKYQDVTAVGKNKTLREQNRIIAPAWYVPGPFIDTKTGKAFSVLDGDRKNPDGSPRAIPYAPFKLKAAEQKRRSATRVTKAVTAPVETLDKRGTPERLATIKEVAARFRRKDATAAIEALAKEGAHRFAEPEVKHLATPEQMAPIVEREEEEA